MKRIYLLATLFLAFNFIAISCSDNDDDNNYQGDGDTIAEVYEKEVNFMWDNQNGWSDWISFPLDYKEDNILIYRQSGTESGGNKIWQMIPRTIYLIGRDVNSDGIEDELDYDYDFSTQFTYFYASGNYDLSLTPQFLNKQIFRIVIVPGFTPLSKTVASPVDYKDYNAVIKYYKIDESKIKIIK